MDKASMEGINWGQVGLRAGPLQSTRTGGRKALG